MKRLVLAALCAAFLLPLLPAAPAFAACTPPPGRSSDEGKARIRSYPIVVYGAIGGDVPGDAHGAYSLFFDVIRWYKGSDPQGRRRLTVTNYADLELHDGFEDPGNRESIAGSVEFLRRFAGQRAVLFLTPRDDALGRDTQGRYKDQYSTTSCTYNVVGNKDVPALLRLLALVFREPVPVSPGATIGPGTPGPGDPSAIPTGSLEPRAAGETAEEEGRSGPITRAAGLVVLVALALVLYRSNRSPLFEQWRARHSDRTKGS
ncbi:MAG TPA: hypothetical protein VM841_07920 [Actinomycetota bacterium]|nr:hypothetical protein [Actinomycetota bacterium]